MSAAQSGYYRCEYDSRGSGCEERNPHGANCHDCAWRSSWDRPRRKHRPTGGYVTGMSLMVPELGVKRLEVLKEAVPKVSRVLVLSYLSDPVAPLQVAALDRVAPSLGVTLLVRDVRSGSDLAAAFDAGMSEHVNGLIVTAESVLVVHSAQIGEFAARLRLPAIYPYAIQVRNGGLMAYEANIPELHKNAAIYVDKILKGAKPSDLPIQQPTKLKSLHQPEGRQGARPGATSIPSHPSG